MEARAQAVPKKPGRHDVLLKRLHEANKTMSLSGLGLPYGVEKAESRMCSTTMEGYDDVCQVLAKAQAKL
jgi:hypothetical protein